MKPRRLKAPRATKKEPELTSLRRENNKPNKEMFCKPRFKNKKVGEKRKECFKYKKARFELATSFLQEKHSTNELFFVK